MVYLNSYQKLKQYAEEHHTTVINKAVEFENLITEKEGYIFLGNFVGVSTSGFSTSSHKDRERFINSYKCTPEVLDFIINANILRDESPLSLITTHIFGKTEKAIVNDVLIAQYDYVKAEYNLV
ncbi:MAG TPA: hypothetical protein VIM89_05555 [Mucilaginibacter sp.]